MDSGKTLVIRNGTLIDGTGRAPVANEALVVEGNRIRSIGRLPADIRLELVINAKTVNALGLTIPQQFVLRADEVVR